MSAGSAGSAPRCRGTARANHGDPRFAIFAFVTGLAAVAGVAIVSADAKRPRVVIELTSDDTKVWEALMNNVENLKAALGPVTVEVVSHGRGLQFLVPSKLGPLAPRVEKAASAGVIFAACENTMKRQNLTPKDLVSMASPVDSGVAELVRKQEGPRLSTHSRTLREQTNQ
jgi:intracellular sulfur oxidation DsrE/DsrF family protein